MPTELAVEVIRVNAPGPERDVKILSVGYRRRRCVTGRAVVSLVRDSLGGRLLPQYVARATVEAEDVELVDVRRLRVAPAKPSKSTAPSWGARLVKRRALLVAWPFVLH